MKIEKILLNKKGMSLRLSLCDEVIKIGDFYQLYYNDNNYYFEIIEMVINREDRFNESNNESYVVAKEVGNWRKYISRLNINFQDIFYIEIEKITDEEMIKKIIKDSNLC